MDSFKDLDCLVKSFCFSKSEIETILDRVSISIFLSLIILSSIFIS